MTQTTGGMITTISATRTGGFWESPFFAIQPQGWMDEAACKKHPGVLEVPDRWNRSDIWDLEAATAAFCGHCPVRGQCWSSASREDREWTVRGGMLPLVMRRTLERPEEKKRKPRAVKPKLTKTPNERKGTICCNGHDTAVTGVHQDGRCRVCRSDAAKKRRGTL